MLCGMEENEEVRWRLSLLRHLLSSVQPYEGGRSAISAYWADYTQAQLGAMMAKYLTVIDSPSSYNRASYPSKA